MLLLDVLIRYSAVTLLLLFAALALRDGQKSRPAFYAMLLSITIAALLLGTSPPELRLPPLLHGLVRFLDIPNIVFVWWFGRSLFEDEFKPGAIEWFCLAAYSAPVFVFRLADLGFIASAPVALSYLIDVVSFGMMAHLAWTTLRGRRDDLIEVRRKLRVYFVLALALAATVAVLAENLFYPSFSAQVSILRGAVTLPLVIWGLFWLIRFQPELLSFQRPEPPRQASPPKVDPRDRALYQRLIEIMESKKAYVEQGLTIRDLAERLSAPEHHLRVLINGGLGQRNFSAFINQYRIAAAKVALSDPDQARTPILTIAMDIGYGSLAPFNRAFKAAEGVTPSEFRKSVRDSTDQT